MLNNDVKVEIFDSQDDVSDVDFVDVTPTLEDLKEELMELNARIIEITNEIADRLSNTQTGEQEDDDKL